MVQQDQVAGHQLSMIALLGSVLLLLDRRIPSLTRERSIVAHIRLNSASQLVTSQAPAIIRLLASTGYAAGKDRFSAGQLSKAQLVWTLHCMPEIMLLRHGVAPRFSS